MGNLNINWELLEMFKASMDKQNLVYLEDYLVY